MDDFLYYACWFILAAAAVITFGTLIFGLVAR